ncbi:zinc finger FYVE domain-containing protein 16 [Impatiens glandulifera]|uniref:zinc finger FYVE domain-containing protein 16 n=1 Tax=Impatiens glandulifera TaxID=253017 RepID=UPI001FB17D68|nr:zinc finger FYVE domain-containing protein 16 [Impatiens glandulifera]
MEPPPFQEASRCDVCKCSFTAFRRRHHCRCCGRTLCSEHSSDQMVLPQFGINTLVRVCSDCFNNASRLTKDDVPPFSNEVDSVKDTIAQLDINASLNLNPTPTSGPISALNIPECKCGMPLCICEAPAIPKDPVVTSKNNITTTSTTQSNPKPRRTEVIPKNKGSTSNVKQFSMFNLGQLHNGTSEKCLVDYEVSGEGLREAIKNGDVLSVKELIKQGVDTNYCDKQGLSLLHIAAVFNQTEIVFALIENGAEPNARNSQGETPLDCAPATLQYKMRTKIEERRLHL